MSLLLYFIELSINIINNCFKSLGSILIFISSSILTIYFTFGFKILYCSITSSTTDIGLISSNLFKFIFDFSALDSNNISFTSFFNLSTSFKHISNDFSKRSLSFFPHLLSILKCPWRAVNGVFNSWDASDTNLLCSWNASSNSSIIELKTIFTLSISSFSSEISALLLIPFSFISFIVVVSLLSLFIKFFETYIAPIPLKTNPKINVKIKIGKEFSVRSFNISFSLAICNVYSLPAIFIGAVRTIYISESKNLDLIEIFLFI